MYCPDSSVIDSIAINNRRNQGDRRKCTWINAQNTNEILHWIGCLHEAEFDLEINVWILFFEVYSVIVHMSYFRHRS